MPALLQLRKLPGKGDGGWGKKCLCVVFWLTRRSRVRGIKCVLGHPTARATSYCLSPDTVSLRASKNVFKVGGVKFANSLSPPFIVKKVRTGSKSSQGDAGQKSRELTTSPEPPSGVSCVRQRGSRRSRRL